MLFRWLHSYDWYGLHKGDLLTPCTSSMQSSRSECRVGQMSSTFLNDFVWSAKLFLAYKQLSMQILNARRYEQNGHHFIHGIYFFVFVKENHDIFIQISLTFVSKIAWKIQILLQILKWYNMLSLIDVGAWCWLGDKPLSGPILTGSHGAIRPQWVNEPKKRWLFPT